MSKFSWSNGFTVGLTVGWLITLIFILFGKELYDLAACIAQSEHCDYAQRNKDSDEPQWWYWTRRLVAAEDTLAQWIMAVFTIAATGVLILTLRSANKTNIAAVNASDAALDANEIMLRSQRPWLTVEIDHKGAIELTDEGFTEDGKLLPEIWFVIRNVGGASAIVYGVYRRWSVCDGKPPFPEPIQPGWREKIGKAKYKDCSMPIGADGATGPIRTWYQMSRPLTGLRSNSCVFFDGYIEFKDLEGSKYICGFCITFANGRFHTAWPYKHPEKYNYHRKLEDVGHS